MTMNRYAPAVVELPNGTFWILSGQHTGNQYTTEIYQNGEFIPGPELPQDSYTERPCATQVRLGKS